MITFIAGATTGPPAAAYIEVIDDVKLETYRINISEYISCKNIKDRILVIQETGVDIYTCAFDEITTPAGTVTQIFDAICELFIIEVTNVIGAVTILAPVPLPTGASTAANQTTEITALTAIGGTLTSIDSGIPLTLGQGIMTDSMSVTIASDQSTLPVSAASLPLPTGASTAANQTTEITALTAIGGTLTSIDSGIPTALGTATMANSMPVTISSDQSTLGVSVSNAVTISGTVPVSAASLPLPSGAATSANQTSILTKLTNIDGGTANALGQATMVNSMPCVIASNQSAIPVTGASTAAMNFGNDRSVDNAASVSFTTIGTKYAMIGLSLGTTTGVNLIDISTFFATSDRLIIEVIQDPTVAGTFTYAAISNSLCLLAIGDVTNTVTSGTILYKTLISGKDSLVQFTLISSLNKVIQAGTTKLVIAVTPLVSNVSVRGILNFKENV